MSNTFDGNLKTQLAKNFVNQFGPFSDDKFMWLSHALVELV